MFRKSALAMAMLGVLASTDVVALGLGDIALKSALNQPLKAEVELLSATGSELDDLNVMIASAQAFARAGIERPLFFNRLKFKVTHNTEGKPVILITSREVVREPFLDFLLEMTWSKGRLLREYTVLVDPPVTMPAPPPVTRPPVSQPTPAPVASSLAPTVSRVASPASVSQDEYGPTRRNDTLWGIANSVRPDHGVSVEQMMLALLHANPEAFMNGNINNLKAGYVLHIPGREEITSISRRAARRETRAQYTAWLATRGQAPVVHETAPAANLAATAVVPDVAASPARVQLVTADTESSAQTGNGQSSENLQGVQHELMLTNETLEEQRRQSEEMSNRLSELEKEVVNMHRLIQLKDDELARIQAQSAADQAPNVVPVDSTVTGSSPVAIEAAADGADRVAGTGEEMGASTQGSVGVLTDTSAPAAGSDMQPDSAVLTDADASIEADSGTTAAIEQAGATPETPVDPTINEPATTVATTPGPATLEPLAMLSALVERLRANPLWLGAAGLVLALLAFLGMRRKPEVAEEFPDSILQPVPFESEESDDEIITPQPESSDAGEPASAPVSEVAADSDEGESDPVAEAGVYLAYGRYQQAEELLRAALEKDAEREDLNLKLLEVLLVGRNTEAFDEHARGMLTKLEDSHDPLWETIANMGRKLSPDNSMYQAEPVSPAVVDESPDEDVIGDSGLDFDINLSFEPTGDAEQPDSVEFSPPESTDAGEMPAEPDPDVSSEGMEQDNSVEFDLEGFDLDAVGDTEEEPQGDGELTDLDEISTKLDLARAYIDMGDPDGARSILEEVMEEGSDVQKNEARDIMAEMS